MGTILAERFSQSCLSQLAFFLPPVILTCNKTRALVRWGYTYMCVLLLLRRAAASRSELSSCAHAAKRAISFIFRALCTEHRVLEFTRPRGWRAFRRIPNVGCYGKRKCRCKSNKAMLKKRKKNILIWYLFCVFIHFNEVSSNPCPVPFTGLCRFLYYFFFLPVLTILFNIQSLMS